MTLLTKLQRRLAAEGNYAAARALAKGDRPRKGRKPIPRKPRTKSESRRIYGTRKHQTFLRGLPCLGCGRMGSDDAPHHLHHTVTGGIGRKADAAAQVPLCHTCHSFVHQHGAAAFERQSRPLLGRTLRSWSETLAHAYSLHAGEVVE